MRTSKTWTLTLKAHLKINNRTSVHAKYRNQKTYQKPKMKKDPKEKDTTLNSTNPYLEKSLFHKSFN